MKAKVYQAAGAAVVKPKSDNPGPDLDLQLLASDAGPSAARQPEKPHGTARPELIVGYQDFARPASLHPSSTEEPSIHGQTHSQSRAARRWSRHPVPARDQGDSEGDADRRRPADPSVRRRRGARGRDRAFHLRHRPQQGRHRGSFRLCLRARGHAQAARQDRPNTQP